LVIVTLHGDPKKSVQYSDEWTRTKPRLAILLLTDVGVFVPPGTLSRPMEMGDPAELIRKIAGVLAGSADVRELATCAESEPNRNPPFMSDLAKVPPAQGGFVPAGS